MKGVATYNTRAIAKTSGSSLLGERPRKSKMFWAPPHFDYITVEPWLREQATGAAVGRYECHTELTEVPGIRGTGRTELTEVSGQV